MVLVDNTRMIRISTDIILALSHSSYMETQMTMIHLQLCNFRGNLGYCKQFQASPVQPEHKIPSTLITEQTLLPYVPHQNLVKITETLF